MAFQVASLDRPHPLTSNGVSAKELPLSATFAVLAVFAVLALGVARDAATLLHHPFAVGTDGYYYVIQINELLNHGRFFYPTGTPLVFYVLAGLSALVGDSVLAVKIGGVAMHALLGLGVYALVSTATRNRWLGVMACALVALPAMHLYMVVDFIKNLCALTLLVWGGWSALRAYGNRRGRRWAVLSFVLFAGATFSHKSAWAIAVSIGTFVFLWRWLTGSERTSRQRWVVLSAALACGVLPALVANQTFIELPSWLARELLAGAHWPLNPSSPVGRAETLALLLAAPLTLFLSIRHREILPKHFGLVFGALALWTLLVTLNPFLNHDVKQHGVVGRLGHLAYVQSAILVPGLIFLLLRVYRRAAAFAFALSLLLLASSVRAPLPGGLRPKYLSTRAHMLQQLPLHRHRLDANPFVIARHGDEFLVTALLGIPAQQRPPENVPDPSVYWLLHRVGIGATTPSLIVVMEEDAGTCLAFIKHEDLAPLLDMMSDFERKQLLDENPHLAKHLDKLPAPQSAAFVL